MVEPYRDLGVDLVVGMESRGFIFSGPIAYQLDAGLHPGPQARQAARRDRLGRVRARVRLEHARDPRDAIKPGQRVLIVDDLLATGGTVRGTIELVERLQGEIVGLAFLVELLFLKGRERLAGYNDHERHPVLTARWTRERRRSNS